MKYIIFILLLVCMSLSSDVTYGNKKLSNVIRVYDGDTFFATILSWPSIIGDTIGIRIYGIDTPEIKGTPDSIKAIAVKAKELTTSMIMSGKPVTLKNIRRDKYFRIVAEVWVGKVSIADTLIKSGLARLYFGGTKEEW